MHVHTNILHIISTGYISDLTCSCLSVLGFRWAAAAGQVSLNGMILPAALYFWQIPHFMALAYLCRDDYAAGGYAPNYILYFECMKLNAMSMLYHIPCCQSQSCGFGIYFMDLVPFGCIGRILQQGMCLAMFYVTFCPMCYKLKVDKHM